MSDPRVEEDPFVCPIHLTVDEAELVAQALDHVSHYALGVMWNQPKVWDLARRLESQVIQERGRDSE